MNNQIIYAIKTYLEEYNKVRGYAAILTTTDVSNTVIVGNVALDITQEVVEGLNAEYIKVRNKTKLYDHTLPYQPSIMTD